MYYIQKCDKPNFWCKTFNIVKLNDDKIILPIDEKVDIKKAEKLAIKTRKIMNRSNSKRIVLSKEIKGQECYVNLLNSYGFKIVDGKKLFKELIIECLEYIIEKLNAKNEQLQKNPHKEEISDKIEQKNEEMQISILINDIDDHLLQNIKQIMKKYKKVNIVTNHFEKFKKIEEQMLQEDGIVVFLSNNKRKSISKSEIILNVDFPQELINEYKIYEEAVIVNFRGNVAIKQKRFCGMNIKDYEISFEAERDREKEELYDLKDLYEAKLELRKPIEYVKEKLKNDKVKIVKLIGNNNFL